MQTFDHQTFGIVFSDLCITLRRGQVVSEIDMKYSVASSCQLTAQFQLKCVTAELINQYSHMRDVSNRSQTIVAMSCRNPRDLVSYTLHGMKREIADCYLLQILANHAEHATTRPAAISSFPGVFYISP